MTCRHFFQRPALIATVIMSFLLNLAWADTDPPAPRTVMTHGSSWEVSYFDVVLGTVAGIARVGSDGAITGTYWHPGSGTAHPFSGVSREVADGDQVFANVDLVTSGPFGVVSPPLGGIAVAPGEVISARQDGLTTSLTISLPSPSRPQI
jgi:hypothetical protein